MKRNRMLKTVLTICFSIFLVGCSTFRGTGKWEYPVAPSLEKVHFESTENGFLITNDDAKKLANNVDELKAHIKKLEALIEAMKKHNK